MISQLKIHQFRNISQAQLSELSLVNLIYGQNGSGKTSILESIYLLSMGRSFRSHRFQSYIQHQQLSTTITAKHQDNGLMLGLQRESTGKINMRIGGANISKLSEMAAILPVRLINADTFELLTGSPAQRRQFLDWGVFHVEHRFLPAWQSCQRSLKQRKALLKRGRIPSTQELNLWTSQLLEHAQQVDEYRQSYIDLFQTELNIKLAKVNLPPLHIEYYRGWSSNKELSVALQEADQAFLNDPERGDVLRVGPHRADIRIKTNGQMASDIFSRGQSKLLISLMMIVQGELLTRYNSKKAIYLVDDLPAELDTGYQQLIIEYLIGTKAQVFVSGIKQEELLDGWIGAGFEPESISMFHVEHGEITKIE